jgi:hypothetical protein
MEKSAQLERLALALSHVAQSEEVVNRQRNLIRQLERDGHPTDLAISLLREFEHALRLQREDLVRIRGTLADPS